MAVISLLLTAIALEEAYFKRLPNQQVVRYLGLFPFLQKTKGLSF
jgi:hypothetical protein